MREFISSRTYAKISRDDVYHLCVREQYYTCGDCEDYEKMLSYVGNLGEIKDELIGVHLTRIATDIYEHSDISKFQLAYGASAEEVFQSIYFNLGELVKFHCEVKLG